LSLNYYQLRNALRYVIRKTWQPLLSKYLSKERRYSYKNIHLLIPPEVFHPGFFFSTRFLFNYLKHYSLHQKTFLELGAGSGLISIYAAKKGANVTATDINPIAIQHLHRNSHANHVSLRIIESDLFKNIPEEKFDFIAINPPYYRKNPVTPEDYAWYCGENGEYFSGLFSGLKKYIHNNSTVLMVLFDGCDLKMIHEMAKENRFDLTCVHSRQNLIEKTFIYKIDMVTPGH